MNATDVIGWIVDGDYYCDNCTPTKEENNEDCHPIFEASETDSFSHCAICEELIQETLTDEGLRGVEEAFVDFLCTRRGRPEILRQWAEATSVYIDAPVSRGLIMLATEEESVRASFRNTCNAAGGLKSALDKAGECTPETNPECSNPACNAVRIIKRMING